MYILIYTDYDDEECETFFRVIFSSKDEKTAQEHYNFLITAPKSKYTVFNLNFYFIPEGEGNVTVGSSDY